MKVNQDDTAFRVTYNDGGFMPSSGNASKSQKPGAGAKDKGKSDRETSSSVRNNAGVSQKQRDGSSAKTAA